MSSKEIEKAGKALEKLQDRRDALAADLATAKKSAATLRGRVGVAIVGGAAPGKIAAEVREAEDHSAALAAAVAEVDRQIAAAAAAVADLVRVDELAEADRLIADCITDAAKLSDLIGQAIDAADGLQERGETVSGIGSKHDRNRMHQGRQLAHVAGAARSDLVRAFTALERWREKRL